MGAVPTNEPSLPIPIPSSGCVKKQRKARNVSVHMEEKVLPKLEKEEDTEEFSDSFDEANEPDQLELLEIALDAMEKVRVNPGKDLELIDLAMEVMESLRCSVEDAGIAKGTIPPYVMEIPYVGKPF